MKSIPTCFFPTKVILIDDDLSVLKEVRDTLDTTTSTYDIFSNPYEARAYMQKLNEEGTYLDTWMGHGYHKMKTHDYCWRDQIYSAERFEQVSTLVLDYMMPGLDGLTLCAGIQNPHVQKIMLTGEADESMAIKAFNDGLIQGFVRKSDVQVFDILNAMIRNRQTEFFTSLTKGFLEDAKEDLYGTVLQNPHFIQIFQDIVSRFNIVEYYLMDAVGKFLLVDAKGNLSALYVYNEDEHPRSLSYIDAEGYFIKGEEFVFPPEPVAHPLSFLQDQVIGTINGQEDKPHHDFPIYNIPGLKGYVWGYIPKLVSLKKISCFEDYTAGE